MALERGCLSFMEASAHDIKKLSQIKKNEIDRQTSLSFRENSFPTTEYHVVPWPQQNNHKIIWPMVDFPKSGFFSHLQNHLSSQCHVCSVKSVDWLLGTLKVQKSFPLVSNGQERQAMY